METLLRQLFEVEGVIGASLIGRDGITIATLMDDSRASNHAAMAATTFDAVMTYTQQLTLGQPRTLLIETGSAVIVLAAAGELLLIVEATAQVTLGRLRLESQRVAKQVSAQH